MGIGPNRSFIIVSMCKSIFPMNKNYNYFSYSGNRTKGSIEYTISIFKKYNFRSYLRATLIDIL
jgi:hypothetical protein